MLDKNQTKIVKVFTIFLRNLYVFFTKKLENKRFYFHLIQIRGRMMNLYTIPGIKKFSTQRSIKIEQKTVELYIFKNFLQKSCKIIGSDFHLIEIRGRILNIYSIPVRKNP